MKKIVICILIFQQSNVVKAQIQGMAILEKISENSIQGFDKNFPIVKDTIWFWDSLVIHQNSIYKSKTEFLKDRTVDTSYYEPYKYVFLNLSTSTGLEYCELSLTAEPYCRFSVDTSKTDPENLWWYYGRGFPPNFKFYKVQDSFKDQDTLKTVVCSYANDFETYTYTYTMRKQPQYLFHLQNELDKLFPEFTTIKSEFRHCQYSETRIKNLFVSYNSLNSEKLEIFRKFKSDLNRDSIPKVDVYNSLSNRFKMNENCRLKIAD